MKVSLEIYEKGFDVDVSGDVDLETRRVSEVKVVDVDGSPCPYNPERIRQELIAQALEDQATTIRDVARSECESIETTADTIAQTLEMEADTIRKEIYA